MFVSGQKTQSWEFCDRETKWFVPWRDFIRAKGMTPLDDLVYSSAMMSPAKRVVYDLAVEIDKTLLATDARFNRSVSVHHHDGSVFLLRHAFLTKNTYGERTWLVCFTEHNGILIWDSEDLLSYGQECHPEIEELRAVSEQSFLDD